MKLIMTLLVRDEEDILRANLEFHRAQGVDFFIITDNKSEDSTAEIAREYEERGLACYIFEGNDDYSQADWVTHMARVAAKEYQADWVINNDADEFWWPKQNDLKTTFINIPPPSNILVAARHDFVPLLEEQDVFYRDMVYRKKHSTNAVGKPLPSKVAHRASPEVMVAQGNHWVEGVGQPITVEHLIDIFHFPVRSYKQFTNKIVKGGQAYERNTTLDARTGNTWRTLYKEYQRNQLIPYYQKQTYSPHQLEQGLFAGELISDRRLSDYLKTIPLE
ncbi:MAG: glycosyltransferase family 2 protein [Pseudomonadota bacterium]|nr:glycosyltransferase family 2 protein [Pseudomonadota bacterium]